MLHHAQSTCPQDLDEFVEQADALTAQLVAELRKIGQLARAVEQIGERGDYQQNVDQAGDTVETLAILYRLARQRQQALALMAQCWPEATT